MKMSSISKFLFIVFLMPLMDGVIQGGNDSHTKPVKKKNAIYRVVKKEISFTKAQGKCDISYSYGFVHGSKFPDGERALNEYVKNEVNQTVEGWRKSCRDPETERLSELDSISLTIFNGRLILVSEGGYNDYQPSVHPGHSKRDYVFDLKRARAIKLSDLFQPGENIKMFWDDFCSALDEKRNCSQDAWEEWDSEFMLDGSGISIETIPNDHPESDTIYLDIHKLKKYWNRDDPPDMLLKPRKSG